jgi:hypothetical protein
MKPIDTKTIEIHGVTHTLVSFDGSSWVLQQNAPAEVRRLQTAMYLYGREWLEAKQAEFKARKAREAIQEEKPAQIWIARHGRPTGRKKGKAQGSTVQREPGTLIPAEKKGTPRSQPRRNLRKRLPTGKVKGEHLAVKGKKPHHHRCFHCQAPLVCACEKPWQKKNWKCGGQYCLEALHYQDAIDYELNKRKR